MVLAPFVAAAKTSAWLSVFKDDEATARSVLDTVRFAVGVATDEATQIAIDPRRHDAAGVVLANDKRVFVTPIQRRGLVVDPYGRTLTDLEAKRHMHDEHGPLLSSLPDCRKRLALARLFALRIFP